MKNSHALMVRRERKTSPKRHVQVLSLHRRSTLEKAHPKDLRESNIILLNENNNSIRKTSSQRRWTQIYEKQKPNGKRTITSTERMRISSIVVNTPKDSHLLSVPHNRIVSDCYNRRLGLSLNSKRQILNIENDFRRIIISSFLSRAK
jgi:hypothetical protein